MLKKLVFGQIILLIFQGVSYFGCEIFQHHFHNVKCKCDDYIPFIPYTGLIYILWFPLIFLFPIVLGYYDHDIYHDYILAMILEIILSVICYLIYPTTFDRPKCYNKLMNVIYKGSFRGINCAPSLHCSSCYLVIYSAIKAISMPFYARIISIIVALGIVISTMTTKQHTIIDALTAIALFMICLLIVNLL